YDRLGIAILERSGGRDNLIYSTCVTTSAKQPFAERLLAVGQGFENAIKEWQPKAFAVEKLFFANNQKTASQVSEVRGVLIYLAAVHSLPFYEYTPLEVKMAITGFGRADKSQVTDMVKRLVKVTEDKRYDDEYDAIAVGLTCLARDGLNLTNR
ncbi:MAG TPA: crossover junction endodeoxyribonuclease RuvC, partial [Candidatus Paceibacterota bacterium]|nr:crossover junction endodeoxyribonuclease RuvC [Candidatus Paceibacterota bacterium]